MCDTFLYLNGDANGSLVLMATPKAASSCPCAASWRFYLRSESKMSLIKVFSLKIVYNFAFIELCSQTNRNTCSHLALGNLLDSVDVSTAVWQCCPFSMSYIYMFLTFSPKISSLGHTQPEQQRQQDFRVIFVTFCKVPRGAIHKVKVNFFKVYLCSLVEVLFEVTEQNAINKSFFPQDYLQLCFYWTLLPH